MPGRPFQSCLEPHLETIRALRLKRRTWQQVAEALKAAHGLEIDPSAIYKFFKRRVHPSARLPLGFPPPATAAASILTPAPSPAADDHASGDGRGRTSEAAAKKKPVAFVPKAKRPRLLGEADLADMHERSEP